MRAPDGRAGRARRRRDELRKRAEESGRDTFVDSSAPIARYFNATTTLLRQAHTYHAEGKLQDAYILYWRGATFYLERVAKHRRFSDRAVSGLKNACNRDVNAALAKLEALDKEMLARFEAEGGAHAGDAAPETPGETQATAAVDSSRDAPQVAEARQGPSLTPAAQAALTSASAPVLLPAVQAAMQAFACDDASAHARGSYPSVEAPPQPPAAHHSTAPPPLYEPSAPPAPPAHTTPKRSQATASYSAVPHELGGDVAFGDASHQSSGRRARHRTTAEQERAAEAAAAPQAWAGFPGHQAIVVPPLVPSREHPAPGAGPELVPSPHATGGYAVPPVVAPPLPPPGYSPAAHGARCGFACPCPAPGLAPSAPPGFPVPGSAPPAPPPADAASLAGFGSGGTSRLRRLHVPRKLTNIFLDVARPNTLCNRETCGILAGSLVRDELRVTHLIVPKQTGSSDQCATTDEGEEDVCMFQVNHDLLSLGWIHTHPSQMCFFSSVDLHTQCGYQSMMDEAVGIVLAPKSSPSVGIFRLTAPSGLAEVQQCREKGFHPYHQRNGPQAGNGVYAESDHVVLSDALTVQLVDLR